MKKNLLLLFVLLMTQIGFAQKKQVNQLSLNETKVEHCTLDEGKTVTCYTNSGRIYLPLESFEGVKGFQINYSKFEKIGEATDVVGSINVVYVDDDGNEKKSSWSFYRQGKKEVYFDTFEINRKRETVNIDPALVKEVYLGFGKNKKVDIAISLIK